MSSPHPWTPVSIALVALAVSIGSFTMAYRSDERASRPPAPNMEWYFERTASDRIDVTATIAGYPGQLEIGSIEIDEPSAAVLYQPNQYSGDTIAEVGKNRAIAGNVRALNMSDTVPAYSRWRQSFAIVKRGTVDFPKPTTFILSVTVGFGNEAIQPQRLIVKRTL